MKLSRVFKSVAAIVVICALLCSTLTSCGMIPSDRSLKKAYKNAINEVLEKIEVAYDTLDEHDPADMTTNMDVSIEMSSQLISMIRSLTAEDFSWVNDAKISLSSTQKNDKVAMDLGLSYNKKDVLSAKTVLDMAKGDFYLAVPALANKYIKIQMGEMVDLSSLSLDVDYKEVLPKEATLKKMIERYFDIVMDNIPSSEHESESLTVNGVAQKATLYEVKISEKLVADILVKILKTAKDDADIKEMLYNTVEFAKSGSAELAEVSADEAYASFVESISESIADIEAQVAAGELSEETALEWNTYVASKKLDILAVEIEAKDGVDGKPYTVFAGKAQNGNDIGVNIYAGTDDVKDFEIEGKLSEKSHKLSGTYELLVEEESMIFVDLFDLDAKKLDKGYIDGSISIAPSKGLIGSLVGDLGADASLMGLTLSALSLKFDFEQDSKDAAKVAVSVMNGQEPYVSIIVNTEISSGKNVTVPAESTESIEEWLASADIEGLVGKLSESGLPEYIIEWVEAFASMLYM